MTGLFLRLSILILCLTLQMALVSTASAISAPKKMNPKTETAKRTYDWDFLEQVEDVEREAWWVLTNNRVEANRSPFRIFRGAALLQDKKPAKKLNFNFCKNLKVINQSVNTWRVESSCKKSAEELGVLQKFPLGKSTKWRLTWKVAPFQDHFGLGTSILFTQMNCEFEFNEKNLLQSMNCPQYARNRKDDEIVEFKTFQYTQSGGHLLKLSADVKKDLHVVSTLKTEVPLVGDIVVKEKVIEPKPTEKPVAEKPQVSENLGRIQTGDAPNAENIPNHIRPQVDVKIPKQPQPIKKEVEREKQSNSQNEEYEKEWRKNRQEFSSDDNPEVFQQNQQQPAATEQPAQQPQEGEQPVPAIQDGNTPPPPGR